MYECHHMQQGIRDNKVDLEMVHMGSVVVVLLQVYDPY